MKAVREFRVEAHGAGMLAMVGGVATALSPFRPEPLLTREGAWSSAQHFMFRANGEYTVVKVYRGCTLVWQGFKNADGSWVDWKSALPVKAVA